MSAESESQSQGPTAIVLVRVDSRRIAEIGAPIADFRHDLSRMWSLGLEAGEHPPARSS